MSLFDRRFQLSNDAGTLGLSCTSAGLSLAGAPFLQKTAAGFSPRPAGELTALIKAAYGPDTDFSRLGDGLAVVAEALNHGDLGRAMVAAVRLGLPDLDWEAAARVARADRNGVLGKYDAAEPRDELGRWTTGGEAARSPKPKPESDAPIHDPGRLTGGGRFPHQSAKDLPRVDRHPSPLGPTRQVETWVEATRALEGDSPRFLAWKATEISLGMGSNTDPGPGRALNEWRTGSGPQTRILDPSSTFSHEFAIAPSTQAVIARALKTWENRPGGLAGEDSRYRLIDYAASFGPTAFISDAAALNGAAHVIGSFRLDGIIDGDAIHWRSTNDMGLHSFGGGHWTDKLKLPGDMQDIDRPSPFGTTRQYIYWDTDLGGKYISQHSRWK